MDLPNRLESVEIKIEGLCSLETLFLGLHTSESYRFSISNLYTLKCFYLKVSGTINEEILSIFLNELPNIELLCLLGNFSYFNLDNLINLQCLAFNATINEDFNFELFNNLSRQLQELSFSFKNDYESPDDLCMDS